MFFKRGLRAKKVAAGTALAVASSLAFAAIGSAPASAHAKKSVPVAMYVEAPSGPFVRNFNPWSSSNSVVQDELGYIYEPLLHVDSFTGKITPKLAASYSVTNKGTTLVFHLRRNVQWSNGAPFTSKDVVFTLNMILSHPGIDLNALNTMIKSVSAEGPYTVVVHLKAPNSTALYYIGGDTPIVYANQWDKVKNPVTYSDPNPITTGPFVVGSFSPSLIVLKKNDRYWDKPRPYVQKILFPSYLSNNSAALAMAEGKFTIATQFVPDIQGTLISRNPKDFHYWFPPVSANYLYTNDGVYPYSLPVFRKALSLAINRQKVATLGEYGYEKPLSAIGLAPSPVNKPFFDQKLIAHNPLVYNPAQARRLLKKAGFTWNKKGQLVDPRGQVVSAPILAESGATDWIADAGIIANNLGAIGIDSRVKTLSPTTFVSDLSTGNFDLAVFFSTYGPGPYYEYDPLLFSGDSAPEGKSAVSNYERWDNPTTNKLLNEFNSTTKLAVQKAAMYALEKQFVANLPVIPLTDFPGWDEYNSAQWTGFPSASNPYASMESSMDMMYIWTRIHPK